MCVIDITANNYLEIWYYYFFVSLTRPHTHQLQGSLEINKYPNKFFLSKLQYILNWMQLVKEIDSIMPVLCRYKHTFCKRIKMSNTHTYCRNTCKTRVRDFINRYSFCLFVLGQCGLIFLSTQLLFDYNENTINRNATFKPTFNSIIPVLN
jgi:hypothetical protein